MLLVAGCGSDSDTSTTTSTDAGEQDSSAPKDAGTRTVEDLDETIAVTESQLGGKPARLEINALRRTGKVIELRFTVINTSDQPVGSFGAFDSDEDQRLDNSVSAVYLVNPQARQRHLVLLDEAGACVCTEAPTRYEPNVPVRLGASFAAPEGDVETMTVGIPNFGTIPDVPVDDA